MGNKPTVWWVIVRKEKNYPDMFKEHGYPLIIYADEERARQVAHVNGNEVVAVMPIKKGD